MTILKKSLLLLVLLLAFYFNGYTQEIIINGGKTERLLTWDDFKGRADKSTGYYAETQWELSFGKIGFRSDQEIPLKDLVLTLKFNEKKSWVVRGKETPELLKHEQGHFDIAEIYARKIRKKLQATKLHKKNGAEQIKKKEAKSVIETKVLQPAAEEIAKKPQAERLETFDGTLASETRTRALTAIVLSWAAILLYLWFRFGNWTFGAAAVICLETEPISKTVSTVTGASNSTLAIP